MTLESLDDIESMKPQSKHSVVLYLYFVFGQFRQAVQILGCYYCLPFTLYLQCICIIQTQSPNIGCSSCLPVSLFPLPLFLLMLLHAAYKYFLIQLQYYKVNRCLARYSPRATTTNRPINRALNKPAWPGPN